MTYRTQTFGFSQTKPETRTVITEPNLNLNLTRNELCLWIILDPIWKSKFYITALRHHGVWKIDLHEVIQCKCLRIQEKWVDVLSTKMQYTIKVTKLGFLKIEKRHFGVIFQHCAVFVFVSETLLTFGKHARQSQIFGWHVCIWCAKAWLSQDPIKWLQPFAICKIQINTFWVALITIKDRNFSGLFRTCNGTAQCVKMPLKVSYFKITKLAFLRNFWPIFKSTIW